MAAPSVSDEKPHENFQEVMYDETSSIERAERQKREKALVRKLDCFIAPVLMILMLISYLDRGNIGFAATQGMSKDINLKGSELNVCISKHPVSSYHVLTTLKFFRQPSPSFTSSTSSRNSPRPSSSSACSSTA